VDCFAGAGGAVAGLGGAAGGVDAFVGTIGAAAGAGDCVGGFAAGGGVAALVGAGGAGFGDCAGCAPTIRGGWCCGSSGSSCLRPSNLSVNFDMQDSMLVLNINLLPMLLKKY
jgi:hypothetical protein